MKRYSVYCSGPEFDKLEEADKRLLLSCEDSYNSNQEVENFYHLVPTSVLLQLMSASLEFVVDGLLWRK